MVIGNLHPPWAVWPTDSSVASNSEAQGLSNLYTSMPHHAKNIAKLEAVQSRATKAIPSLRNKSYEESLAQLNMFFLEKLIECFKIFTGFTNADGNKLFSTDESSRARSNGIKLRCKQIELDCTKFFFTNDVVREWNKLPPSVVQCIEVNSFKNKLDHHLLQQGLR